MNRAQRRAEQKSNKNGKKSDKECSSCLASYDKEDKQMVTTWNVVVKEEEKIVRLYCPDCWNTATQIIKDAKDDDAK